MIRLTHSSVLSILAAAMCVLLSGCLVNSSHTRVVRQDETARAVEFESEWAHSSFHSQAMNDEERKGQGSKFWFGVPLLLSLSYNTVPSSSAYYNDWVTRTDANQDGLITDQEVATAIPSAVSETGELPLEIPMEEIEFPAHAPSVLRVSYGDDDSQQ